MTPAASLLFISLLLALAALSELPPRGHGRRPRGAVAGQRHERRDLDAYIRIARIGDGVLAEHASVTMRVAPDDAPRTAIDLASTSTKTRLGIQLQDIRAVRGWIDGRPSFTIGNYADTGAPLRALSKSIAAWELEVITADGGTVRCYGRDSAEVERQFLTLRRQVGFRPGLRSPNPSATPAPAERLRTAWVPREPATGVN